MARRGGGGRPRGGTIIRKAIEFLVPPRVRGPNRMLPTATVRIERKPFMPRGEFQRKMDALQRLGDQGRLYKATNPVARNPQVTRDYRQDMIRRIHEQYGTRNPDFSQRMIDRITQRMQPDHIWELQLGGPDHRSNLRFLDADTNTDIGRQIWRQIRNLPDGTPIRIEVIS